MKYFNPFLFQNVLKISNFYFLISKRTFLVTYKKSNNNLGRNIKWLLLVAFHRDYFLITKRQSSSKNKTFLNLTNNVLL